MRWRLTQDTNFMILEWCMVQLNQNMSHLSPASVMITEPISSSAATFSAWSTVYRMEDMPELSDHSCKSMMIINSQVNEVGNLTHTQVLWLHKFIREREREVYTNALKSASPSMKLYRSEISYVIFLMAGFRSFSFRSYSPHIPADMRWKT